MKIDWWTLALEAINVAVLMWLLARFFWKPIIALLDERRAATMHDLDDAAAKRAAADKALASIASERAGIQKEREAVLAKAVADAEKERALRVEKATTEIEALRAASEAAVVKEKSEATKALNDHAASLAVDIAARLLRRLDTNTIQTAFLDGLTKQVKTLSTSERQTLTEQPLKLIGASDLTPDEQTECRHGLEGALGAPADLSFETDPNLIAGFVLDTPNVVIGNSWRHDLDRIRAELKHD
jgi:F-type H+-transporting ATPase subunit b